MKKKVTPKVTKKESEKIHKAAVSVSKKTVKGLEGKTLVSVKKPAKKASLSLVALFKKNGEVVGTGDSNLGPILLFKSPFFPGVVKVAENYFSCSKSGKRGRLAEAKIIFGAK